MNMTWKELIEALEARGWLVTQLAGQIGKSPAAICDIKADRTKEPKGMAAVILYQLYTTNMPPPARAAK
ncbi:MAG: XRE family transcriptional regulator [Stenotrophomonas sp.]|uniref:XRE family transcriptional regulator n=1 Tax=Stenotrophomonas sp. TaxID=69392 RepID=UPI003D6D2F53